MHPYKFYLAYCSLQEKTVILIIPATEGNLLTLGKLSDLASEFNIELTELNIAASIQVINAGLEKFNCKLIPHKLGILLARIEVLESAVYDLPDGPFHVIEYEKPEPTMTKLKLSILDAILKHPKVGPEIIFSLTYYFEFGCPVGDFLEAVLANDMMNSFGRADIDNQATLFEICNFIYNDCPHGLDFGRGSYAAVKSWTTAAFDKDEQLKKEKENDTDDIS